MQKIIQTLNIIFITFKEMRKQKNSHIINT